MEVQALDLDMISKLPSNIAQTILTLMPMRDAFRTSVLSRNWRDHCVYIPRLQFDEEMFQGPTYNLSIQCKLLHVIYPILLLHRGPVLDFSLCLSDLTSCFEIDKIIFHLARNCTVKRFTLCIGVGDEHTLPPSFFMLQQLEHLTLQNCSFQPPPTFKGFDRLISLSFHNVSITAKVLLRFISSCPRLKHFTLMGFETHLKGCWKNSDFAELFECLPLIDHLHMSSYPIECFSTGVTPNEFSFSLIHLTYLHLTGLCFARETEIHSALLLVTSSPNIETIKLEMQYNPYEAVSQTAMNLLDLQDYSYVTLNCLRVIEITNFANMKPGMDFVKLILAKSVMLKEVDIVIGDWVNIHNEVKMLRELIQYPRASTRAEIRFRRP